MIVDGQNILNELGIGIESGREITAIRRKRSIFHNWADEHGENVALNADDVFYQPRTFTLNCIASANSGAEMAEHLRRLMWLFSKPGLRTLEVPDNDEGYLCYAADGGAVNKIKFTPSLGIGKFALKLVEPNPFHPVITYNCSGSTSVSFTLNISAGTVRVWWGDGTWNDYMGSGTRSHTYPNYRTYKVGMSGDLGNVTNVSDSDSRVIGDAALVFRGLSGLTYCNFQSCNMTSYSGAVIPVGLTTLDFGANNFRNRAQVDNCIRDLLSDGAYQASDRGGLSVDLAGSGMPGESDSGAAARVRAAGVTLYTN
jgi:hypothetical protein